MKQKTTLILACLLLLTITLFSVAGCSDSSDDYMDEKFGDPTEAFTFAVISDSHVKSRDERIKDPDWERAAKRLTEVGKLLGSPFMETFPEFVVHTGDHVNDLYCPMISTDEFPYPWDVCPSCNHKSYELLNYGCCLCDYNCYHGHAYPSMKWHPYCPPPILLDYATIITENFRSFVPYYMVLGNHDDRWLEANVIRGSAKDEYERMFGVVNGVPTLKPFRYDQIVFDSDTVKAACYEFDYKGFHFIMLDSTADPYASNDGISFGGDQLRWLSETLKNNTNPAILFWHKNPGTAIESVPNPSDPTFDHWKYEYLEILYPHRNKIKYIFVGHSHSFNRYTWPANENDVIQFRETTSTMCSEKMYPDPVFYLVTCNPADGSAKIINEEQIFSNPMATVGCKAY
jgi:hypothetical protein